MTSKYGKVAFGKDGDDYFAYLTSAATNDFACSSISQEDAFMKLCDILANKLNNIQNALNKDESLYT